MSEIILEKVGSAKIEPSVVKEFGLEYFDLKKYSSGKEIEQALPEKHLFGVSEVYSVIGVLMGKQVNGEEGVLLNDGNFNIFYTEKFCVSVHWYSGCGYWDVFAWGRGRGWLDGLRVFSPGLEN